MKEKIIFICQECGSQSPRWQGKCNVCGSWDSFIEKRVSSDNKRHERKNSPKSDLVRLDSISSEAEYRIKTGNNELDRVLGGGIIPGSLVLVGGDPGIGKSTLMLQMCSGLGNYKPLYVTGEESLQQIKYRSQRLEGIPDNLLLMSETNIEEIDIAINSSDSGVIIVDSIQAVYSDKIDSSPGSIVQVRECAALLMQTAKKTNKPIFIVGHVTKEGIIAGPKVLEHMVDTVIQFEGEKTYSYRILRAVKNRFGSTNEIGIFEMEETGLREVTNPSELFLAHRLDVDSGISIVAAIEGTRPVLLEVQALVSSSSYSVPQRSVTGFDIRRLQMILAVLEKRMGLRFGSYDIFVNVAGGIYLSDPSVDLGIAIALVSSLRDKPVSLKSVFIGEIGLTGEVRGVSFIDQ
ncbi:MAG: DNA repair protein RadA, partial [FCB group bacterium]